jgi:hypothetical protein
MTENKQTIDIGEAELDKDNAKGSTGTAGKGDPNAPTPQEEKAAIEQDDGAVPSKGY